MRLIKEKDGITIDGVPHIKPNLVIHLIVTFIFTIWAYTSAVDYGLPAMTYIWNVFTANVYTVFAMLVYWFGAEFVQERKMVKAGRHVKGRHWKFWTWSQSRWQDILIPELSGVIYTSIIYIILSIITSFL